jgi:asparagine synthase (glutamine-hydrolysing)
VCGIVGFAGPWDEVRLADMSHRVAHRGPDDDGAMLLPDGSTGRVGLAQRRLSIVDLSPLGHQPMSVSCRRCGVPHDAPSDRRLWLVFNGEIYDFRALREDLVSTGHRFQSQSDTEVLLHAYGESGPRMLERLNGIFTVALYDGRPSGRPEGVERGDLLLARDGFGVKPLYLAELDQGVLFASELKALLSVRELPREIDPTALIAALQFLFVPGNGTPFRAIRKAEPGEAMWVRGGRVVTRRRFFSIPQRADGAPDVTGGDVRAALLRAVARQSVADVEVGAYLSGGVDSTAIVAAMKRLDPRARVPSYCIGFRDGIEQDGHVSDLPYARIAAARLGVELRPIEVGPEIIDELDTMLWHLDEPQPDPAPILSLLIARAARRDGIKVLMSGQGGDDVWTGYRRHRLVRVEALWGGFPQPIRGLLAAPARAIWNGRGILPGMGRTRPRQLARAFVFADRAEDDRLIGNFAWASDATVRSLLSRSTRETVGDPWAPMRATLGGVRSRDRIDRILMLEQRHFLADHNLNYTDKTSMAAGVEVRVPLLDREMVTLAASIPTAAKMRGGEPKALFRAALAGLVPEEILNRPKTGFGVPLRHWLGRELKPKIDELLSPRSLRARDLFDPDAVQRLRALEAAGRIDAAYTIFSLACIETWCRIFVDKGGTAP